ncbi:hypothetical protein DLAC_02374 [Tieghemostelium lacteum]|uniref:DUF6314 domain-containing protein n=1 Tax=Tieghemostelium lacteum TaxID=361077 RepID=A0A152A4W3_TIELA|nr:hypothetical protein DLAC_02374 [Tieghemostelium lacteum]|eukprot:KYR01254.1 hypothetical protein DLAC_02374 [Tieghemostelium lacteum]
MLRAFRSFSGRWNFTREILHKNNNERFSVNGIAKFQQLNVGDENTLQYQEEGVMKQLSNSQTFNITQRYIYQYDEPKDQITVYFDENPKRLFHHLTTTTSVGEISNCQAVRGYHLCELDHYNATYQFLSDREFQIIYSVQGPKKDYEIKTLFTKLDFIH